MDFRKVIKIFFIIVLFFGAARADAAVDVHLSVVVGSSYLYNKDISVSACDSNNDGGVDDATAYCALSQSGVSLDGSWSPYGYFINGINGVNGYADSSGDWHYWEFYTNGSYASVGVASYKLAGGDDIVISFLNPSDGDVSKAASNKGGVLWVDRFSKKKALDFISSKQMEDGSFGKDLYTDWVAVGIAKESDTEESVKDKLKKYLIEEKFSGISLTDYERRAMSLMSLGINPYSDTKINYIKKITDSFDGKQLGDKDLINDDIFGLIVLQNAGYSKDDKIISSLISYILSKQNSNGSWGGSVDMTSAAIMALNNFKDSNEVDASIHRGFKYIKSLEVIKGNKSFGNPYSASWAMQAFTLEDYYEDEVERSLDFLTRLQKNEDGYIKEQNDESILWATAYSVPAVSGLSWNDILEDFEVKD